MPFTFSHPAAILPLRLLPRHWTSLTGLIVGSMAPDFEYFIRLRGYSTFSHSWFGLLWFCLPVGISLAFIYHRIVRDAFIDNLPGFIRKRVSGFKKTDWQSYFRSNYSIVIASILIGSFTHVMWDGLTHKHGLFVKKDGWFDQAFIISGYIMPRYKMLQHTSTIIGAIFILFALFRLPASHYTHSQKSISPYWLSVTLIMIVITTARMSVASTYDQRSFNVIIVTVVAGWILGVVFSSLYFGRTSQKQGQQTVNL